MAFGDIIQKAQAEGGAGFDPSLTATFAATPTQGNLLIAVPAVHNSTVASVEDGGTVGGGNAFTQAETDGDGTLTPGSGGIWWRIAGASQSTQVTMAPAADGLVSMAIMEVEGPWEAAPVDVTANGGGRTANTTSKTSGTTAATAQADEVAVVGFVTAGISSPALSNSFILDEWVQHTSGAGLPDVQMGHKVLTATGTQESTSSWTGTADALGFIATFKKQAAATGGQAGVGGGLVGAGLAGGRGGLAA